MQASPAFNEEQILGLLKLAEAGEVPLTDLCHQLGVSEATFYLWMAEYSEERILGVLKEAEAGVPVAVLCQRLGVSEATFYRWKAEYANTSASLESTDIIGVIKQSLSEIKAYHKINKDQARHSFAFGVAIIFLGLLIVGVALVYGYKLDKGVATLSSITGLLLQFIGGANIYMYNKTMSQLEYFYDQLIDMQNTMLALKVCEELKNSEQRDTAKVWITRKLLVPRKLRTDEVAEPASPQSPSKQPDTPSRTPKTE